MEEGSVSTTEALGMAGEALGLFLSVVSAAEGLRRAAAAVVVSAMRAAVALCLAMSMMLVVEKLSMAAVALYVKLSCRTPEKVYKWEPVPAAAEDAEMGSLAYPMVLVQIPMFNEREVLISLI